MSGIIADFIGLKKDKCEDGRTMWWKNNQWYYEEQLLFDKSFDWIMEAVKLIQSKWVNTELRTWHIYTGDMRAFLTYGNMYKGALGEDKELVTAIYKAVVEYLKYNEM